MATVICVSCGVELYDCKVVGNSYAGTTVRAEDFVPLSSEIEQPKTGDPMNCPFCKKLFVAPASKKSSSNGVVLKLLDGSWWPFPPLD